VQISTHWNINLLTYFWTMTENALVSVATGKYIKSMDRLEHATGDFQLFAHRDSMPRSASPHRIIPYQFKPQAIWNAYQNGYRNIIWFDSIIYPNRPLDDLFSLVKQNGYLIFLNGWTTGQWCADSALQPLGITRDESFVIPHAMACVMGFDLTRPDVLDVFLKWKDVAPSAYPGSWNNLNHAASTDDRVLGHRHDQTAISVLAHRAGWTFTPVDQDKLFCYGKDETYYLNSYHAD
jgi:hypothetical protein